MLWGGLGGSKMLLTDDAVGVGRQEGSLDPSMQGIDDDAGGLHQR
jgi:hypothetical protein